MLAMIQLEDIHNEQRNFINKKVPGKLGRICAKACKPPWVADITNGFKFIRGHWDYLRSKNGRGIIVTFFLEEGKCYDVYEPGEKIDKRYKCMVIGGKVVKDEERTWNKCL